MRTDPKCSLCGIFQPSKKNYYQPLICPECLPGYKQRKFTFVRATQIELNEIFSTKKGFTCQ